MDTKNQQNNFNNPVVIILVLALIGLGGYALFSKNSNVSTTQNTTENTQTPVAEQKIIPQAKTQVADQATLSCDTAAKKYFDTWQPTYSYGFSDFNLSYKNYYSQNNNSCYVLVSYNFKMKDNSDGSSSQKINYTLADVSKKDPGGKNYIVVGSYAQSISSVNENNNRIDTCTVSGTQCYSLQGFLSSVQPYLGN